MFKDEDDKPTPSVRDSSVSFSPHGGCRSLSFRQSTPTHTRLACPCPRHASPRLGRPITAPRIASHRIASSIALSRAAARRPWLRGLSPPTLSSCPCNALVLPSFLVQHKVLLRGLGMAQDDHAQSHGNSPSVPPAPGSASSPAAAVSAVAPAAPPPAASATPAAAVAVAAATVDASLVSVTPATDSTPSGADADLLAAASTVSSASASAAQSVAPQQNGDSRASEPEPDPTPDTEMSNQYPGAPHGQPVSYPGPSSPYPSAIGISTAQYASYPAATTQSADGYRPNPMPVGSNVMSLPSMRTIDSIPQQPGPSVAPQQVMSMNMPMTSVSGGVPFYGHHGMPMAQGYGLPSDPMARYALPHDPRLMGHRGPKKEIKRRTKTGCLTCRKRRIKCDETHPTCNNCKKSKRECLGYDPIFRQQPGSQSASNIQPAPLSQPTTPSIPSSVPSAIPCSVPSSLPSNPALTVRSTNSYGSQPSMLPSSYAAAHASTASPNPSITSLSYDQTLSTGTLTPVKSETGYEYSTAIDPALQTFQSASSSIQDNSRLLDHRVSTAKKMKIDEIIDLLGPGPPPQQTSHTEEMFNEITKVYHEMYAPGLSSFFETNWYYFAENGNMSFPRDVRLVELMASFLRILEAVRANDHAQMAYSGILETRIVWELSRVSYQTMDMSPSVGVLPREGDANEAKNRVRVVEALLCGDFLSMNPLSPPAQDPDPHRTRQFDFWYNLAEFVRTQDNSNTPEAAKAREDVLSRMRHLLDGRENRDVLYSIAVVRELAPNFEPGYGNTLPQHLDETDPKNRLAVASKFILDESQVTGGTTNVVRRFSDIASRALVNPGVNIIRRT
ncbi:hypothetical protein G7Z17_g10704 [Cylindrodendrum hubeiense]|uniref:Zn(2)-C6 fungal-type domain-containing protein n=1 Tax=Cylindrodendrum hubeiense TaxID=595255 RepID=A0A9P5H280_9HYPO|nr:hypothetical protein G7Z17_g10704 [Cylindrodendrum hubeiense]